MIIPLGERKVGMLAAGAPYRLFMLSLRSWLAAQRAAMLRAQLRHEHLLGLRKLGDGSTEAYCSCGFSERYADVKTATERLYAHDAELALS